MLMDEPMGALDAKLREEMRTELKRLHLENSSTTVYVTHDQVEAMSLADRIAIMNEGVLQQVGTPDEIYHYPANLFVAQFVGSPVMNVANATINREDGVSRVSLGSGHSGFEYPVELAERLTTGNLTLGIRPEGVLVSTVEAKEFVPVEAHLIEPLGAYDIVDLKVGGEIIRARTRSGLVAKAGDAVWAKLDPLQTHFFDTKTGATLGIRLGHGAH
jgi:multiple sugar transport system ATP-binding protein